MTLSRRMDFKTKPYDHQLRDFERFKDAEYFGLFADMGTGKSKVAIDICAYKYLKGDIQACLIIAPNNVHTQWVREQFPLHCPIPYRPFVWQSGKSGNKRWRESLANFLVDDEYLRVLAVNVEAFQSDSVIPTVATLVKNFNTFIIVDEATRIKNRAARRTKAIHKLNKYGQRCILTGTPTAKSPFDLWSQMEFLKANYFDVGFFVFQHRYGVMMQGVNPFNGGRYTTLIDEKTYNLIRWKLDKVKAQRGSAGLMPEDYEMVSVIYKVSVKNVQFIEQNPRYTRYKRLDELRSLIARDVSSVRKEDCLDLPEKVYERIYVDMSKEQKRIYDNLVTDMLAEYEGTELTVVNKVALTTRLMQVCGGFFPYEEEKERIYGSEHVFEKVGAAKPIGDKNPKVEALLADLEEVPDDASVIVWAHFTAEVRALYAAISKVRTCATYYGATSQKDREDVKRDFMAGEIKVLIGNPSVAGFGLNLQRATLQYFFSNSFRTEDRLQAEDRSHRIGVKSAVVYKDIVLKGTVDEDVYGNIATGRDLNDYFKRTSLRELLIKKAPEDALTS